MTSTILLCRRRVAGDSGYDARAMVPVQLRDNVLMLRVSLSISRVGPNLQHKASEACQNRVEMQHAHQRTTRILARSIATWPEDHAVLPDRTRESRGGENCSSARGACVCMLLCRVTRVVVSSVLRIVQNFINEKKQSMWLWTVTCSLDMLSRARAGTCVRRCQVVCGARLACQGGLTFVVRSVVEESCEL